MVFQMHHCNKSKAIENKNSKVVLRFRVCYLHHHCGEITQRTSVHHLVHVYMNTFCLKQLSHNVTLDHKTSHKGQFFLYGLLG